MEPERRIEKLLRAFAKKRREQAGEPFEISRAARQQLQKEISSRSPETGGGFFSGLLVLFRPRFAFALGFVALVIAGLLIAPLFNGRKPATFASANSVGDREEMAPAEKAKPVFVQPPASTPPPVPASEGRRYAARDKQTTDLGTTASAPPSVTAANRPQAAPAAEAPRQTRTVEKGIAQTDLPAGAVVASAPPSNDTFAFKSDRAAVDSFADAHTLNKDATVPATPTPVPANTNALAINGTLLAERDDLRKKSEVQKEPAATGAASVAMFDSSKNEVAAAAPPSSQFFNRTVAPAARRRIIDAALPLAPVLASFRVEQNGSQLRVVDADGSVYTGAVQVAQTENTPKAVSPILKSAPSTVQAAARAPSPAAQNYFFRVAGTNRNLNQNVVFSGNFIPLTNVSGAYASGFGEGGASAVQTPANSLLLNSQISGKAVIGNQKEIEVNATPAP
jgi:hypothetical protein